MLRSIVIFIIVLNLSAHAFCATSLIISNDFKEETIGTYVDYYLDETNSLTIDDIINNRVDFIDNNTRFVNLGYSRGSAWFRLIVDNQTRKTIPVFFEHQSAATDKIELYVPDGKTVSSFIAGDHVPFKNWQTDFCLPSFKVAQRPGKQVYYFKVQDLGSLLFYMKVKSKSTFYESKIRDAYVQGGIFVIAALMLSFNLFLAFSNRLFIFVIVSVFVIFSIHHALYYEGIFQKYLWPGYPGLNDLINIEINLLLAPLIGIFWIHFSTLSKRFKNFCYTLLVVSLFFVLVPFYFDYHDTSRIVYGFTISSMVFAYIWCCFDLFKKIAHAKFFSTATTLFFVFSLWETLRLKVFFNYPISPFLSDLYIFTWNAHYGYFISFGTATIGFFSLIKISGVNDKNLESQKEYLIQVKERENIKNHFIHTITHELGTPIQGLKQMVQLLSYDDDIREKHGEIIHIILQATDQIFSLTNEFITYARYENHKVSLTLEDINIKTFVNDIVESLKILNENKYQHEIVVDFKNISDDCTVSLDKTKIRMALLNILTNALKYTPNKGTIIVSAYKNSYGSIIFSIADNGIGISLGIINNIYEAFFKGKNYSNEIEGKGLGLAIAKYAIELHGGTIVCKSPPPFRIKKQLNFSQNHKRIGSVFYISLPPLNKYKGQ